jgi:hypothetical protein
MNDNEDLVFHEDPPDGFDITEENARAREASRSGIVLRETDDDKLITGDESGDVDDDEEADGEHYSDGEDF